MAKRNINIIKEEFESRGYELLENNYINNTTKMEYICKKHPKEKLHITYSNFKRGKGCRFCGGDYTFDMVKEIFEEKGYKLLEHEYIDSATKMKFKCPKHFEKELSITLSALKLGYGCKYCGSNIRYELNDIFDFFDKNGFVLMETNYKNSFTKMKCYCKNHPDNIICISYNNLKNFYKCKECEKVNTDIKNKEKLEKIRKEFCEVGYELLDNVFSTTENKFKYKCPNHLDKDLSMTIGHLRDGRRCPYCSKIKFSVGLTDLWTTKPEIAKHLYNKEDGYKYRCCSKERVDWICPQCGSIVKQKAINAINKHGITCSICRDGISYNNKIIANLLKQLKIKYISEYREDWCKKENSRSFMYDFYLIDYNAIIEVHGEQHFIERPFSKFHSLEYNVNNDKIKQDLAFKNNISNYLIIDFRCNEVEFFKESILKSGLFDLLKLKKDEIENIDWTSIVKQSQKSKTVEVWDIYKNITKHTPTIAKMVSVSRATVLNYLKRGLESGVLDDIKTLGRQDVLNSQNNNIKI